MIWHGAGVSGGIGIGQAVLIKEVSLDYSRVKAAGPEKEKQRFKKATDLFRSRTSAMAESLGTALGGKESDILTGQIAMLEDPFLLDQIDEMLGQGACAEAAADKVLTGFVNMFATLDDELMRQRASDIRDLRTRLLKILLNVEEVDIARLPAGTILLAHDLVPSMTVGIQSQNIMGIVTEVGGKTSHSAILARALEVPAVLGVEGIMGAVTGGTTLITDGTEGTVLVEPDAAVIKKYTEKREAELTRKALLQEYHGKPTLSADGRLYHLYANIGTAEDAVKAARVSAEGIGLFRTEFLFMERSSLPTEEEQLPVYLAVSDSMPDREIIIRTLDVGGDKGIAYLHFDREDNPFLGYRAIRFCLDNKEIFSAQLRALLRAGAKHRNIKIMLPMISTIDELMEARELVEKLKNDLSKDGIPHDPDIKVGIMIETPAAALIADVLAQEADFFSIGTNDLTQYTLAVDRGNARVKTLYSTFNPAVLRSIRAIVDAAHAAGISVGMCGEAAGDPLLLPVWLSFGLDELSVNPAFVLRTRKLISQCTTGKADSITAEVMHLSHTSGIEAYLRALFT